MFMSNCLKTTFILMLGFIFFTSCKKEGSELNLKTGTLIEEMSIKSISSNSPLLQVTGFDIDRNDYIYAFDLGDFQLKKFSFEGHLIDSTGRKGKGPGEFQDEITFIESNDKYVYSYANKFQIMQVFDKDLNYLKTINLKRHLSDISSNSKGVLLGVINEISNEDVLYKSSFEIDTVEIINANLSITGIKPFSSFVLVEYAEDNSFFVGYRFKNLIQHFSKSDSLLYEIKLPNLPEKASYYNNIPQEVIIRDITYSNDEKYLYILEGYNTEKGNQIIYVLDKIKGDLIYKITVPVLTHSIIYQNGYLYTSAGRGSDIIRYKIEYNE